MTVVFRPETVTALPVHEAPLVRATAQSLAGYGAIVEDYRSHPVEIVTWPAPGWRAVDAGTGNEGGTTEGVFESWWSGDVLYGRNNAVQDTAINHYLLGWSRPPAEAVDGTASIERKHVLLWHANYHPDGGQLFYPLDGQPFVLPLALPGDDVKPENFVGFYCDGSFGVYIHPGIWHEGVFPVTDAGRFFDKQGKVHARISCDFAREFGCYLAVPLHLP
jgi:hypothetical protein